MKRDQRRLARWTHPFVHRVAGSERYSDGLYTISHKWTTGELSEALRFCDWDDANRPDINQ